MSIKLMYTYHLNLLASRLDYSNVRMSPLHTGPLTLHIAQPVTVIQEFDANLHTPLPVPNIPTTLPVRASQNGAFTLHMMEWLLSNITPVEEKIK